MSDLNYMYINGFWNGFVDNNFDFFKLLFSKTKFNNFEIVDDINKANILFESVFASSLVSFKNWKYKIHYSGEPFSNNHANYDIVLDAKNTENNVVDLPLCVYYIYGNSFLNKLINRMPITTVPSEFCCFIISNASAQIRNTFFHLLNNYKRVDSHGKSMNNMNNVNIKFDYNTPEYMNFINRYKFIICFENTKTGHYITEKLINPFIARIIPIYWGTHHVKTVFNPESILLLEDETPEAYSTLINKIIELDNDDNKYLEFINRPIFTNIDYWNNHYAIEVMANNINKLI
jgi:hypothetical protein